MKICKPVVAAAFALLMALEVSAQSFKVYPGATKFTPPSTAENKKALEALPPGATETIYITNDAFEKVVAFYAGFAKGYTMPYAKKGAKLSNGQELKESYFIFDGAKDLMASKSWAKVQRPYIGSVEMNGYTPEYHDIRDETAIVLVEKK